MAAVDFAYYFEDIDVGYMIDDYESSYLAVSSHTSGTRVYTITAPAGSVWVGIQFLNPRFFPLGCKSSTTALMKVKVNGSTLIYTWVYDWNEMNAF